MAEVFGVVSAGIGVAAFAVQISETIRRLRDIREYGKNKASAELKSLVRRLERLREILLFLETVQTSRMVDLAIEDCQLEYSSVDDTLQRMSEKLSHPGKKLQSARHSEGIKNQLRDIGQRLDSVIQDLTLSLLTLVTERLVDAQHSRRKIAIDSQRTIQEMAQDMALAMTSSVIDSSKVPKTREQPSTPASRASIEEPIPPHTARASDLVTSPRRSRALDCTTRHCHCSCHLTHRSSARFWAIEYTSPTTFFEKCSNTKCTASRYRWSLQFALSRYGIPFMVNAAVEFITGAGRYSLRPGLSIERVVKYTSPGFEALWRFRCGQLKLSEVQQTFRELRRGDPSLNRHIHPGGRNYVQELLYCGPSRGQRTNDQFELLKFFACELGMTLEGLDQRFLVQCVKWIGEGPHIDLLKAILAYGFDPGSIESPVYEDWPYPCSPNWISEEHTPDPFFIDYLALLADASPGFAGLTPLHEIVLLDPPTSVTSFLSRSSLHMERNFLGQTPLHLAVHDVETVRLLVQSGHDMDIQDNHGITPLMYAAGMDKTDVVRLLIEQGANPFIRDTRWERNFIDYAAARSHWPLIMDILDTVQDSYSESVSQYFICCALMRLISRENWLPGNTWSTYFAKLVGLCSDVNIKFGNRHDGTDDNNLLHFISNNEDVKVLARQGFELFGQPNSAGKPAIFSLVPVLDATLIQSLLDYGININHVDHKGRTILFPLLQQLQWLNSRTFDVMDSIRICLKAGLDIFISDGCRCACSPGGCFLPAGFDTTFVDTMTCAPAFVWALEFLSLVEELRGREDSKRLVLGFLRRNCFERAGITHVCCHRGNNVLNWELLWPRKHMADSDIDEILDEEEELIADLEEEMLPLNHKTLECLRSDWILMLKEKHDERLEAKRKEHNNSKGPVDERYEVDYKNDTFCQVFNIEVDFDVVPLANSMAEYVIWLEHQYIRSKDTWNTACEGEAWYKRRMSWFVELMQVMEVAPKTLIKTINNKVETIPCESDGLDKEGLVSHFMASMQETREAKTDI